MPRKDNVRQNGIQNSIKGIIDGLKNSHPEILYNAYSKGDDDRYAERYHKLGHGFEPAPTDVLSGLLRGGAGDFITDRYQKQLPNNLGKDEYSLNADKHFLRSGHPDKRLDEKGSIATTELTDIDPQKYIEILEGNNPELLLGYPDVARGGGYDISPGDYNMQLAYINQQLANAAHNDYDFWTRVRNLNPEISDRYEINKGFESPGQYYDYGIPRIKKRGVK